MWQKTIKHAFSVSYSDKTWVSDQSDCAPAPFYIIKYNITSHHIMSYDIKPLSLYRVLVVVQMLGLGVWVGVETLPCPYKKVQEY